MRDWLEQSGASAVVLTQAGSVAWLTGGLTNPVERGHPSSPLWIVVGPDDATAMTSEVEAPRLEAEGDIGMPLVAVSWFEPGALAAAAERAAGVPRSAIASDGEAAFGIDASDDLAVLRLRLLPDERERLRELAHDAALALEESLKAFRPGELDRDIQARIADALERRGALAVCLIVGGDDRVERFRHPLSLGVPVQRLVMAVVVAERGGLHAAATRYACAAPLSPPIRAARAAALDVEAAMLAASTAGATYGDVLQVCDRAYAAAGHPQAWREHYQGGPIGYRQREFEIAPPQAATSRFARERHRGRPRARVESRASRRRQVRGHVPRRARGTRADHGHRQLAAARRWPAGGARCHERNDGGGDSVKALGSLERLGLPRPATDAASASRFPDGAEFRIEIPSVEGPRVLAEVIEAATRLGITVNRVSQGSGAMLLSVAELQEMSGLGAEASMEVSLFVGPREGFDVGAHARTADGSAHFGQVRGARGLAYAVEDVARACEAGIRSFLVADLGLLAVLTEMQQHDELPRELVWKISVMMAPSNPAAMRLLEQLGATTVNVPSDMTLGSWPRCAPRRQLPIDLYVESPDSLGGVVRGNELGRPGRGRRPAVRQVRPAQLTGALPIWRASRREARVRSRARRCIARRSRSNGCVASRRSSPIGPGRTRARNSKVPAVNGGGSMSRKRIRAIIVGVAAVAVVAGVTGAALAAGQEARRCDAHALAQLRHRRQRRCHEEPRCGLREGNPDVTIKVVSQPADNYFALFQAA